MKKAAYVMFIFFFTILLILFMASGNSTPSKGDNCNSCHDEGDYEISADQDTINTQASTEFTIKITASGNDLIVEARSGAEDNDEFEFNEDKIEDNDGNDDDDDNDAIETEMKITSPNEEGEYTILIIAREDKEDKPDMTTLEITVIVGEVNPLDLVISFLSSDFIDHLGVYLGGLALMLLTISTILVVIKENKFAKTHGYLAGTSWILTLINVLALLTLGIDIWTRWEDLFLVFHYSHIFLGGLGLVTGFFSMLFGIAAERKYAKITGYLTLLCWWGAFFTGYLLIY